MSALDELKNKNEYSAIEWAIVEFSDEKYDDPVNNMFRRKWLIEAAAELAEMEKQIKLGKRDTEHLLELGKQTAALTAELEAVKRERDELFNVAVKAFQAMKDIELIFTPEARALDSVCTNLSDDLWERVNAAALSKAGQA